VPGRLRARKKEIQRVSPERVPGGLQKLRLRLPEERGTTADLLGSGADAAPAVVEMFQRIGVLGR
jgi:electron transfer flavoprotein beta subunit